MRNTVLKLRYLGTNFHGWQKQPNGVTVQELMEDALFSLTGSHICVTGAGRTDSGVHANEYYANFRWDGKHENKTIVSALNHFLPTDISVLSAEDAPEEFHSRYSAKGKEYIYQIYNSRVRDPFLMGRALHYPFEIDMKLLSEAAQIFVGEHDFRAFMASGSAVKDTVRTVWESEFIYDEEKKLYIFRVLGNGFLYNMVRIMVGTLLALNEGKLSISEVKQLYESGDRKSAGPTAPPEGLYLNKVIY